MVFWKKRVCPPLEVVNFVATEMNMDAVDLDQRKPCRGDHFSFNRRMGEEYEAFPIGVSGAEIEIVFGNPLDRTVLII